MKKTLAIMASLVMGSSLVLAQGGPGPGGSGEDTPKAYSNYLNQSSGYRNLWGEGYLEKTDVPKAWSNAYSYSYGSRAEEGKEVKNRFGKPELPADVQKIVQQFQQERNRLMSQLKTGSDEQRKEILKNMEQLRTQLREQIQQLREQAQQQAEQMRTRFGNNRDRILDQGAGNGGTGRDR